MESNVSFANPETSGVSPAYIWMGQVVDEGNWVKNHGTKDEKHKVHTKDDVAGYGYRYKVRIFGRDISKKVCTDNELVMAEVLIPVTGGSGHGGSGATPNIRQGMYVVGYYKDGIIAREPIIFGVLPNHSQTVLFGGDPKENFIPRTGYIGKSGSKPLSNAKISADGGSAKTLPTVETTQQGAAIYHVDQYNDGKRCFFVPKTRACDKASGELKGIQKALKDVTAFVNQLKANANGFLGAVSDINNQIESLLNDYTIFISGIVKTLIDKIRGFVVNAINKEVNKRVLALLPPNLRSPTNTGLEKGTDILQCVFNKILKGLAGVVLNLLRGIVDKYINAPMCAAEEFIGSLISNILNQLIGPITSILGQISGGISAISGVLGSVLSALDVILGVLKFLSCEEDLDCSMGDQWSFWDGVKCSTAKVAKNLKGRLPDLSGGTEAPPCNTSQLPCGPPTISFSGGGGSGVFGNPIVSATGSLLGVDLVSGGNGYVAPPNVLITDICGKGNGAIAFAKIGPVTAGGFGGSGGSGGLGGSGGSDGLTFAELENDITEGNGSGDGTFEGEGNYDNGTFSGEGTFTSDDNSFINQGSFSGFNSKLTGKGTGKFTGTGEFTNGRFEGEGVFVSDPTDENKSTSSDGTFAGPGGSPVIEVIILDSGVKYLPAPDGTTGGGGITFSKVDDTIVFNPDKGYNVYPPNSVIPVLSGDDIYMPPQTIGEVYDNEGNRLQIITGQGQLTPIKIDRSGTITTPRYTPINYPGTSPSSNGLYPVVLTIKDTIITNPGFNYDSNDKIKIIPDNGAELTPKYDDQGRLISVNIDKPGIGFTDFPEIFIESDSGFNAQIIPIFGVIRVGDLPEDQDIIPEGTPLINVVDCVGKV